MYFGGIYFGVFAGSVFEIEFLVGHARNYARRRIFHSVEFGTIVGFGTWSSMVCLSMLFGIGIDLLDDQLVVAISTPAWQYY